MPRHNTTGGGRAELLGFTRGEQVLLMVIVAAIISGSAALIYVHSRPASTEPVFTPARASPGQGKVIVHIAGAVRSPGVYTLAAGFRVNDAIRKAGGAKPGALLDALNMAQVLQDGEKVFVATAEAPEPGAVEPTDQEGSPAKHETRQTRPAASGEPRLPPGQKVSINRASVQGLEALPGIGPVYAQRIVDYRKRLRAANGTGFTSIEQLMEVPGIGAKRFERLRPHVTL